MTPYYELVQVDAIRPSQTQFTEPEILAYFRLILTDEAAAKETPFILQPIPLRLATYLIPGSIWSADGEFTGSNVDRKISGTYRELIIGKQAPSLSQLSNILPDTAWPDCLIGAAHDAWYATVQVGVECILIPCFELLRAFCYKETNAISNFFILVYPSTLFASHYVHHQKQPIILRISA